MNYRTLVSLFLALCLTLVTACSSGPANATDAPLTYDEIKNSGLANNCPELSATTRGVISIAKDKSYILNDLCLQPTSFFVKEEPKNKRVEAEFVPSKLVTRYTSSIDKVRGKLVTDAEGRLKFLEEDGFDFQAITVQLPGGELVPFLFSIKGLVATAQSPSDSINTSTDFEGTFNVTGYRTANFLDPKGRGVTTGYDTAVALPASGDEDELIKANTKRFEIRQGNISLQVTKVDSTTGEIAGTFKSEQPSDTDLEAKEPKEVKILGNFYARVESNQN